MGTATPTHLVKQNAGQQSRELNSAQAQANTTTTTTPTMTLPERGRSAQRPQQNGWQALLEVPPSAAPLCQIRLGFGLSCSWR